MTDKASVAGQAANVKAVASAEAIRAPREEKLLLSFRGIYILVRWIFVGRRLRATLRPELEQSIVLSSLNGYNRL